LRQKVRLLTVIDKKIADKNICEKYIRGTKMTLLASEHSHFGTADFKKISDF
jgi:hypothetical protein